MCVGAEGHTGTRITSSSGMVGDMSNCRAAHRTPCTKTVRALCTVACSLTPNPDHCLEMKLPPLLLTVTTRAST